MRCRTVIITNAIVPRFKAGDFAGGIERGVDGIIAVLTTDTADWQPKKQVRTDEQDSAFAALRALLLSSVLFFFVWSGSDAPPRARARRLGRPGLHPDGGPGAADRAGAAVGGGFGGGGGFSGGGGSSGGGGASGSW